MLRALEEDRRAILVAVPTFAAIYGNRFMPGIYDRILAHRGYDDQQTDEPESPRPDNLFGPLPGDHGAHGRFDDRALAKSSDGAFAAIWDGIKSILRAMFVRR